MGVAKSAQSVSTSCITHLLRTALPSHLDRFLELVTYDLAGPRARDLGDQLYSMRHLVRGKMCAAMGNQRLVFNCLAWTRHHKQRWNLTQVFMWYPNHGAVEESREGVHKLF